MATSAFVFLMVGISLNSRRMSVSSAAASSSETAATGGTASVTSSPASSDVTSAPSNSSLILSHAAYSEGFTFDGRGRGTGASNGFVELLEQGGLEAHVMVPATGDPSTPTAMTPVSNYGIEFEFRTPKSNALLLRRWFPKRRGQPQTDRKKAEREISSADRSRDRRFPAPREAAKPDGSERGNPGVNGKRSSLAAESKADDGDGRRSTEASSAREPATELWVWLRIGMLYVSLSSLTIDGSIGVASVSVGRGLLFCTAHRPLPTLLCNSCDLLRVTDNEICILSIVLRCHRTRPCVTHRYSY
jgi:hypothetical protein